MYILTDDGKIYEGLALTPAEVEIVQTLPEEINNESNIGFVNSRDRERIIAYILSKYFMVPRYVPAVETPEVETEVEDTEAEPETETIVGLEYPEA